MLVGATGTAVGTVGTAGTAVGTVGATGTAVGTVGSASSSLVGAGGSAGPLPTATAAARGLADGPAVPVTEAAGGFGVEFVLHAATSRPTMQQSATDSNGLPQRSRRRRIVEALTCRGS